MTPFDPKDRELCPDGGCIGVIGPDGRCKECGKAAPGWDDRKRAQREESDGDVDDTGDEDDLGDEDGFGADDRFDGEDDSGRFSTAGRELCTDDMCVGVIGPDGTCKECGRPGPAQSLNPRTRGLRTEEEVAEQLEANIATSDIAAAPDEFEERRLCPDGNCVGVIGPDGHCTECGALAEPEE